MLEKVLGTRADVLAPLAAQKKDIEGGNLEWPEREIVLVSLPPKSMLQEVQMIRRWDGLEPMAGATGDWSGGEPMELGEESGGGEGRVSRGRLELKAADGEPREPQTKGPDRDSGNCD